MRCEECQTLIGEYVAGELGAGTTGAMSAHFDFCGVCRELYAEELREQEIYSRYLLAVKPAAGVWNELAARIEREHSAARVIHFRNRVTRIIDLTRARVALPAAAAILLLIGCALLVATFTARRDLAPGEEMAAGATIDAAQNPQARPHEVPNARGKHGEAADDEAAGESNVEEPGRTQGISAGAEDERRTARGTLRYARTKNAARRASSPKAFDAETPERIVNEAESQHLEAIALLKRDIATREAESTAGSTAQFDEALDAIDRVIDDTRRAVRGNPNDPIAVQHLLAAYGKKIDVLEELASRED